MIDILANSLHNFVCHGIHNNMVDQWLGSEKFISIVLISVSGSILILDSCIMLISEAFNPVTIVCFFVSLAFFIHNSYDLYLITHSPSLYIIDHIRQFTCQK